MSHTTLRCASTNRRLTPVGEIDDGGEGTVYELAEDASLAAKIYKKKEVARERFRKLEAMLKIPPEDPGKAKGHVAIAWPRGILLDNTGSPVGFYMDKISNAKSFNRVYHPTSKKRHYPGFNFLYLLRVCVNISTALAAIHDRGIVVGDLNGGNVLIHDNTLIAFIDCDSYQVGSYTVDVGRDEYLPPDLQGLGWRGLSRTVDQDNFGLAVMVYLLLMRGGHPYAGMGEPSDLGRRIKNNLYANHPQHGRPSTFATLSG